MEFLAKTKQLNKHIGFHIFSIAGLYETLVIVYIYKAIKEFSRMYPNGHSGDGIDWYLIALTGLYVCLILLSFISYFCEKALKYEIKNNFILNNKIYNIFLYSFAFLSLMYFICLIYVFFDITVF